MQPPVLYCDYTANITAIPAGGLVRLPWQQVHLYPVDGDTDAPVVNEGRYIEGWVGMQSGGRFYVASSDAPVDFGMFAPWPFPYSPMASLWTVDVAAGITLQFRVAIYSQYVRLQFLITAPTRIRAQAWVVDYP